MRKICILILVFLPLVLVAETIYVYQSNLPVFMNSGDDIVQAENIIWDSGDEINPAGPGIYGKDVHWGLVRNPDGYQVEVVGSGKTTFMLFENSNNVYIMQQKISGCLETGITLYNCQAMIISEGEFFSNAVGIHLYGGQENEVLNNKIKSNTDHGVLFSSSHANIISRNTVCDNGFSGMWLAWSIENFGEDNIFSGNELVEFECSGNDIGFSINSTHSINRNETGVTGENSEIEMVFTLHQNYPNPFNPTTNISYTLPREMDVRLVVYDATGREIKVLVNGFQKAGAHYEMWDASDQPSGTYLFRLQSESFTEVKRALLQK